MTAAIVDRRERPRLRRVEVDALDAIAARHHGVKFMVVAPSSTVDMATASGDQIEIEERDPAELLSHRGERTVAAGIQAWNPVFDVTPHELIDAIVTERGVVERPDSAAMQVMFGPRFA